MKRLLLILLFCNFVAQAQNIQITFVEDYYVGIVSEPGNSGLYGNVTDDTTINGIFANHNISWIYYGYADGYPYLRCRLFAEYSGSNLAGLLSDLENYANVESAKVCPDGVSVADILTVKLLSSSIGNPIGVDANGNVITTNPALNTLFVNYEVKSMTLLFPTLWDNIFQVYFEGDDAVSFKSDLENLDTIIESAYYGDVIILLSTEQFEKGSVTVHPNPFKDYINIESSEAISSYALYDLSGKEILNTSSKNILDNACSSLVSGIYMLRLESENGTFFNQKLVKK